MSNRHFQEWRETEPGRWERPLGGMESYFVFFGNITASMYHGRQHFVLCSIVKLELDTQLNIESALKQAWIDLRYEQPDLASTIDVENMRKVYTVPDQSELDAWLAETFFVVKRSNATELYPELGPIQNATLYWLPQTSQLMFRAEHWKTDGLGILSLWNALLTRILKPPAQMHWGSEPARLAPTMEAIWGFPETPTSEQDNQVSELMSSWIGSMPGCGPKSKVGTVPPGRCTFVELDFSAKTTRSIATACKERGISITSAIHAAFIAAIAQNAASEPKKYVTFAQFNARPYLTTQNPAAAHALVPHYTPWPYSVDLPISFIDSARRLHAYYSQTFADEPERRALMGHFLRKLYQIAQTPEYLSAPVPTDALVSGLGIVEKNLWQEYADGRVKVTDFRMTTDVVMGMSMIIFYTFCDRLRLTYAINEAFQERADVEKILESTRTVLEQELGI